MSPLVPILIFLTEPVTVRALLCVSEFFMRSVPIRSIPHLAPPPKKPSNSGQKEQRPQAPVLKSNGQREPPPRLETSIENKRKSDRASDLFAMSSFAEVKPLETDAPAQETVENGSNGPQAIPQRSGPKPTWVIKDPLVWIDLEMTGLDLEKDTIIEIACIVTNGNLDSQIEGPSIAIKHPDRVFDEMSEWCQTHHKRSGLTNRCKNSTIQMSEAEREVLKFVKQYVPHNSGHLAGNSVHVDKSFLRKYMPHLHNYLHFRIVDVSSIGELCRRWHYNEWKNTPRRANKHTALSDIRESIEELKYFRRAIFKRS